MSVTLPLGFLASHAGTSMKAIVSAIETGELDARASVVISNNADAPALAYARCHGIPALHISAATEGSAEAADRAIADALSSAGAEFIVLSGYLRPVGPETLNRFPNRVLNIHPSLLPKYGGRGMYGAHVHEEVIANREKITGATVHLVDEEYDHGPVIAQVEVPVELGDTPEQIKERVMAIEPTLYLMVLKKASEQGSLIIPHLKDLAFTSLRSWRFSHDGRRAFVANLMRLGASWIESQTHWRRRTLQRFAE